MITLDNLIDTIFFKTFEIVGEFLREETKVVEVALLFSCFGSLNRRLFLC